jgi:hypothetical protein
MDTVYRRFTKSNGYTFRKKNRFKFFSPGGGEQTITFFKTVQPIKIVMDIVVGYNLQAVNKK